MSELARTSRSIREAFSLGYYLTQAHGFDVISAGGRRLGVLDRLRYERQRSFPRS